MTAQLGLSPYVIGIGGGSASGKSLLASGIQSALEQKVTLVSQDDYYHSLETHPHYQPGVKSSDLNWDDPIAIESSLMARNLRDLVAGNAVKLPRYDFTTSGRVWDRAPISPTAVIIIEGLFVLLYPEIRELLDMSIFVSATQAVRQERRLARDVERTGESPAVIIRRLGATVFPMHDLHIAPTLGSAQLVVENNDSNFSIEQQAIAIAEQLMQGALASRPS